MPFEQFLLFFLGLCSILLYTVIIVILKKHRTTALLGGTFFRIVEIQYYAETIFFIEFSVTMRFRKYTDFYTLFEQNSRLDGIIPRFVSGIHYYIKIVVYFGYIVFALNRLFAALNVSSYNNENISVWSPSTIKYITLCQWLLPLLGVLPTHAWPGFDFYFEVTSSAMRLGNDSFSTNLIAYIDGACSVITCIFCMVCYIVTCVVLRKKWKPKTRNVKSDAQSSAERGLLIAAIASFLVLILNTAIQVSKILISWFGFYNIYSIYDISYPMVDLMYSHFPWVLLSTSSVLRRQLIYDVKLFLRSTLKLDEASMSMARVGQTTNGTK